MRLWQRKRREEERPAEEPAARPVELPKLAGGGEQLRKAFLERLEQRDEGKEG